MAEHLTEEEQLEALKRWWKENGQSTIIGVLLAVSGYLGWTFWQDSQRSSAEAASAIYQDLIDAVSVQPGEELSDEKRTSVNHLADQLKESYSSSLYANNAALFKAKLAVERSELAQAEEELRWVIQNKPSSGIEQVAKLRLSRVLLAQEKYDDAMAQLSGTVSESFESAYAEVRGDILIARGDTQKARAAYQTAMDKLPDSQNVRRPLLQMKLDDLQENSEVKLSVTEGN